MSSVSAAFADAGSFDGRIVACADRRPLGRRLAGGAAVGLGAVATVGLSIVVVTLSAAWLVNGALSNRPHLQAIASGGPVSLALVADAPALTEAQPSTFADKWARVTASMPVRAVALATPQTQVAVAARVPAPVGITPLPRRRPVKMADFVPLPKPYPGEREIVTASIGKIEAPPAPKIAAPVPPLPAKPVAPKAAAAPPPAPAEMRVASREAPEKPKAAPGLDNRTAVYDIDAHTVYLPNGERLEAHSGIGDKMDDPRYVKVPMRGPTPPNVYDLTLREEIFHGVRAIRLNPVDDDKMYGRAGMLAHSYMLGPNGQSNGCVSFRNYDKFLNAYLNGEVKRLVVVAHLDNMPTRVAYERRGYAEKFASNY
ncbi:MAG: DUF2778 domain-containing protein [Pseudolabrys sp.]